MVVWECGCVCVIVRGAARETFLMGLLVGLPMLSAAGFVRMKQAVLALCVGPLQSDPKLVAHQLALNTWRHNILMLYLTLLIAAFVAGQLRNWRERRRLRKATMTI